jgi:hypothetical protein
MPEDQDAGAEKTAEQLAAEETLTQKLEAALARIAQLEAEASGPPAPPKLEDLQDSELMLRYIEALHVLTGSHPSVDGIVTELRARMANRPEDKPQV